jgi:hypothetical protein
VSPVAVVSVVVPVASLVWSAGGSVEGVTAAAGSVVPVTGSVVDVSLVGATPVLVVVLVRSLVDVVGSDVVG